MKRICRTLTAGALLASGWLASGCSLLPKEAGAPAIEVMAPVVTQREIATAKKGPIESTVSVTVSFGANEQESLYFRNSGRLKKLRVQTGQHVAAGQPLAELEAGNLPYDVKNAEDDLKLKQAILAEDQAKKGFVNEPSALDLMKDQIAVDEAQTALRQKQDALADTQLSAPFSGTLLSLTITEGDQVDAYKEVAVIAADGPVIARAKVDDATAAQLQTGQAVKIYPNDGDPTAIAATVTQAPVTGAVGNKIALITPDQPSSRMKVGGNGKADVVVQSKPDALLVPLSAVRSFGGRQFVTVVKGESRQEVAVTTGLQDTANIEVTEGIQAGDQVVSR